MAGNWFRRSELEQDPRDRVIDSLVAELEQARVFMGHQEGRIRELHELLKDMHHLGHQAREDQRRHEWNLKQVDIEFARLERGLDQPLQAAPEPRGEPADFAREVPGGDGEIIE